VNGNTPVGGSPWASPHDEDEDLGSPAAPSHGFTAPDDGGPAASSWGAPPVSGWNTPSAPPEGASPQQATPGQHTPPPGYQAGPDAYARFKPGIITLRPLSFGQILDGGIKALRHNPKVMLGLNGVVALVATIALYGFGFTYFADAMSFDTSSTDTPFTAGGIVSVAVGALVSSLLLTMVTALSSVSVGRSIIGVKISPRDAWSAALKRMPTVIGVTLLMLGATVVGYGVLAVIIVVSAAVSPVLAVVLGLVLGLATVVAVVWVSIKLALTLPAAVLERLGPIAAIRRSWNLTTGRFWMILSVLLVATIITSVIQQVISAPVSLFLPMLAFNSTEVSTGLFVGLLAAASYIGLLLSTVFLASVTAVVYTDQRMRREGFDLILAQSAQRVHGA